MPAMKKVGDWDIVMEFSKNLPDDIKASTQMTLAVLGGKAEALAKKHMATQDLKWKPLNPEYLIWKAQEGFDTRILLRKQDYYKAITHDLNQSGTVAWAGVKNRAKNSEGVDLVLYAKIMEYGSIARNIAARPLWSTVIKEVKEFCVGNNIFVNDAIKAMNKRARK